MVEDPPKSVAGAPPRAPYQDEHREDPNSGTVRAAVFGVSDGLVSNLALVMGVAGGTGARQTVILAGVAGLVAGALSMAAGEYVSMRTQREMFERELALERSHIEKFPHEEEHHLAEILVETGVARDIARRVAAEIHRSTEPALGVHARLELGLDPGGLGSPVKAALVSFGAFVIGALVPLLPWLLTTKGLWWSLLGSGVALFAAGAGATRLTIRSPGLGGLRQLLIGMAAAAAPFGIGRLVGVSV